MLEKENLEVSSHSDDDGFLDFWLEQQPILTDDEKKVELERLDKNADWVLKSGIGVNLDSIY